MFPGSAQLIAGNRRLGRFVVSLTMLCWLAILALVAIYFIDYSILLNWAGHPNFQLFLIIVLSVLAVGWLIMFINTLVIIRRSCWPRACAGSWRCSWCWRSPAPAASSSTAPRC
ncbi:hypothetical protein [Arthrobacter sp. JCM 19049]|uniref:hypothetical protein n=1 Tax=Arthrobacter sp. JCM 19049 TaxID=1460643 RepID=UPI0006D0A496|nr:hypothetical protein [Arthrobacter sp. JCM 19049]